MSHLQQLLNGRNKEITNEVQSNTYMLDLYIYGFQHLYILWLLFIQLNMEEYVMVNY
jgi:hypothetical protein